MRPQSSPSSNKAAPPSSNPSYGPFLFKPLYPATCYHLCVLLFTWGPLVLEHGHGIYTACGVSLPTQSMDSTCSTYLYSQNILLSLWHLLLHEIQTAEGDSTFRSYTLSWFGGLCTVWGHLFLSHLAFKILNSFVSFNFYLFISIH